MWPAAPSQRISALQSLAETSHFVTIYTKSLCGPASPSHVLYALCCESFISSLLSSSVFKGNYHCRAPLQCTSTVLLDEWNCTQRVTAVRSYPVLQILALWGKQRRVFLHFKCPSFIFSPLCCDVLLSSGVQGYFEHSFLYSCTDLISQLRILRCTKKSCDLYDRQST